MALFEPVFPTKYRGMAFSVESCKQSVSENFPLSLLLGRAVFDDSSSG
jgi:hypothetical protein